MSIIVMRLFLYMGGTGSNMIEIYTFDVYSCRFTLRTNDADMAIFRPERGLLEQMHGPYLRWWQAYIDDIHGFDGG